MIRLLVLLAVLLVPRAEAILCVTTTSTTSTTGEPVCPSTNTTTSVTTTTMTCPSACPTTTSTSSTSSTSTTTLPPVQGTFYIDNSCANNGDGTVNACAASPGAAGAWNRLNNMQCIHMVAPDSTVIIRSHGGTPRSQRYFARWTALESSFCSGSLGHPLTIENAAGEDVVMEGTVDIRGNTWTDRGGGIWECTSGTDCGPPGANDVFFGAWYTKASISGGAEQFVKLQKQIVNACASSGLTANQMAHLSGTAGHLCVRLADDSSPATTDYFEIPRSTDWLEAYNALGLQYVTLRKNPGGGSWTIQRFRNHIMALGGTQLGWVFDGLHIGWVFDRCLYTVNPGGAFNATLTNLLVEYCGQEGIRLQSIQGGTTLVENNEITHTQDSNVFFRCSPCRKSMDNGTPLRLFDDWNLVVRGNSIHDFGGSGLGGTRTRGLDLEGGGASNLIENNYIYNQIATQDHGDNEQASGAINFSAATVGGHDWSGNIIRNNRMENVEVCWRFQADFDTITMSPSFLQNNTCVDARFSGVEVYGLGRFMSDPPFSWTNNVFSNTGLVPIRPLVHVPTGRGTAFDASTVTYNSYYCAGCASSATLINWNGVNATANQTSVQLFDPNSQYGDPVLDTTGSPPTLKILNAGSAYSFGFPLVPVFPDFEGTVRPQSQGWDIGADEFTGTTATTTSSTTSTSSTTGIATTTTSSTVTTTSTSTSTTTLATPVQVFFSGGWVAAATGSPSETALATSTGAWVNTIDQRIDQVISEPGILGGLRATVAVDPGGTASWTLTVYKNHVATGLTCTISAGSTSCTDTTAAHNVTFGAGDRASIRVTPANTPASGILQLSTLWRPGTTDHTAWLSSLGGSLTAANAYLAPFSTRNIGSTRDAVVPVAGTVQSLSGWTGTSVITGASRIFTFQKNDIDTTLTCSVPEGMSNCTDNDVGHAVTVAAGDKVRTVVSFTGVPADNSLSAGQIFIPSATGTFVAGMGLIDLTPTTATTKYSPLNGAVLGTNLTTETLLAQSLGQAMTVQNLYVLLNGATGSGSTLTLTLRKNAADTALTCAITNASTCNLTTNVTVANDDLLDTAWVHTGSAGSSREGMASYSAAFTGSFP